ncbi:MAG: hypothetical protein QOC80_481 [Frankiaceae bacterium]|jgi:hypothetical protein|nr:hypothetical protein [Frankiaceae bacterium]
MSEFDLILHVGMPRSGAVLRRALSRLRPQLRMHGVAFVGKRQIGGLSHVAGWDSGPTTQRNQAPSFERELSDAVAAERGLTSRAPGRRPVQTIVSCDRLLGTGDLGPADEEQFRPYASRAMAQVITALSAHQVQIVLYTHRQDRLMELSYLKRIREGRPGAFADEFPFHGRPVLDYLDLIDRLLAVPKVADVVVRPVELVDAGQHALVNDFLGLVGLENALDLYAMGIDPWPYPPVYSARGAQLALVLNPLMDTPRERRRLRAYLWDNYRASERYATDLLDRGVRQRILDCYAERNQELFRRWMPDLPSNSYDDDPSTFALGNVLGPPRPARPAVGRVRRAISRGVFR